MNYHIAVCVERPITGREGFVITAINQESAVRAAELVLHRIGYVGGDSFPDACRRAAMMERDEPHAWGVLPESARMPHGEAIAKLEHAIQASELDADQYDADLNKMHRLDVMK